MPTHGMTSLIPVFAFLHCDRRSRFSDRESAFCLCVGVEGGDPSDKLPKVCFSDDVNLRILFAGGCLLAFDCKQQGSVHWLAMGEDWRLHLF